MIEIPDLAAVGLAAGSLSALVLGAGGGWIRSRRARARHREEIATLQSHLAVARQEADRTAQMFTAEIAHLVNQRIPAETSRAAHPHVQVPGVLHPEFTTGGIGTEFSAGLESVLDGLRDAMAHERKRVDAAARAGMRGATREIQAGLYRLQDVLRGLQQRYDDPELAGTLFALDHENEQSLRRAQVAAVVCGAWVGLAREASHLVEAVTGGQSRLVGYHRVQVNNHLQDGTALVSHAVEPVAIIVAELLDNALRHSSPDTTVVVNLECAHHGVTVTVDDSGVGMAADERAYAQRMVAGRDPILLSDLGDPPRMGLAAIGQLTRQFDLSVDLSSPSPYGGVRAVVLVKNHLLSHIDPFLRPPSASAPRSTRGSAAPAPPAVPAVPGLPPAATRAAAPAPAPVRTSAYDTVTHESPNPVPAPSPNPAPSKVPDPDPDTGELPQRRRRARSAEPPAPTPWPASAADERAAPARSPEEAAAALGALQAGTAAARQDGTAAARPNGSAARVNGSAARQVGSEALEPRAAGAVRTTAEADTAHTARPTHTAHIAETTYTYTAETARTAETTYTAHTTETADTTEGNDPR